MKKWPFFAIILPWMASYGSERSFVLIFSAKDDLGKVSWKMDARKCKNQVTPPFFDHLSESRQTPLQMRDRVLVVGDLLLGAAPSGRSPSPSPVAPHLRTVAPPPLLFSRSVILPKWLLCRNCPYQEFSSKFDIFSIDTSKENNPRNIFLETCLFTSTTKGTMPKLWFTYKSYKRCFDQISIREPRQKTCEWKYLNRGWAITSDGSIPCSGQLE